MESNNTCACCEGISAETPLRIANRPGLSAVAYRAGTWATFRESLLAALSDPRFPALRALTTRENDDFSIALLDAWAVTADVLTFYQERIANESWLGTATEQRSIVELARLIGYELRPGVAASSYLAFTMDKANMQEAQMQITGNIRAKEKYVKYPIPKGTRIQSIPGPGEKPQVFETSDDLEAMAEWNAIKPKLTQKQTGLANETSVLVLKNTNLGLKINDLMCIREKGKTYFRKIARIEQDDTAGTTAVYFILDAKYRSFTEPDVSSSLNEVPSVVGDLLTVQEVEDFWSTSIDQSTLLGKHNKVQNNQYAQLRSASYQRLNFRKNHYKLLPDLVIPEEVIVFRKRANAFGYNAPKQITCANTTQPNPPANWIEWTKMKKRKTLFGQCL